MPVQAVYPYFSAVVSREVRAKRLDSLAPLKAPSALRVPPPEVQGLALVFSPNHPQVFIHEGARQALERRLEMAHEGPVRLHISDNLRRMISFRKVGEQLQVRVHHMFLDASPTVQRALVAYIVRKDKQASDFVSEFIAAHHHRIRAATPPQQPLRTAGKAHDLWKLFQKTNQRYFGNLHDVLVTWGTNRKRASDAPPRRSIKLGSYNHLQRLIRVHPVLDQPWVPRYFVRFILYHEMLHHVIAAERNGKRVVLHPPEFRQREREFAEYERAMVWEQNHLERLLRY
jgi:hypothetical protein